MSSNIEERIVEMTFRGTQFVQGVEAVLSSLEQLKKGLDLKGAENSLNQLDEAGKRFSLSGLSSGVSEITSKFGAMGIAGITAVANIANRAVNAGVSMVKALTIDPVRAGLQDYETKIGAIQTILANTSAAGTTLNDVTKALDQLNVYADKTIFNFADMTRNIGFFTAAGVNLQTSVDSIKGISNLAALSGASAEQATGAMYQLSQAISAGKVTLEDWNSVVNAGLGGKVFQDALLQTARVHGVAVDDMIKKDGSFRLSLQEGWLTSQILTETLSQFTGDLSLEQIKAMGYTDQEAQAILKMGQTAVGAATNIRTISQLFGTLKEEVASSWGGVWETLIGNFNDSTTLLTGLHNVLSGLFTKPVDGLNTFLQGWVQLGGKQALIDGLSSAFKILSSVFNTIKGAWKEVFPPATSLQLVDLTVKFKYFIESLTPGAKTLEELRRVFVGVFSVLKIGWDVIEGVFSVIGKLFGAVQGGSGGFLTLTARIADFVTRVRQAIESGGALTKFFDILGAALAYPIKLIGDAIEKAGGLGAAFSKIGDVLGPVIKKIQTAFGSIADAIGSAVQNADWGKVVTIIEGVLGGSVLLAIRKFISGLGQGGGGEGGGLLSGITESFDGLTESLKTMQTTLKAKTLEEIAIAVGVLAASMVALSFINVQNLGTALGAITVMFTQLLGAMAVVTRIAGNSGIVKMAVIAGALNLLATAILILSGAVAILAQFSWEELAKGVGAVAVMLGVLAGAVALMSGNSKGVYASAAAMEVMAVAMNVMAVAVAKLGAMDWTTLGKGVGTIAALLLVVAGFNKINSGGMLSSAAGMLILGAALNVIALAIKQLGSMDWTTLGKGMATIAAALLVIAGAMQLMPANMILTATGLLLVSASLLIIGQALQNMGGMSWGEIAKGLVTLAGSLLLIAAATIAMSGALAGAAAIAITAAALALLAPVLQVMGNMSWGEIGKSMLVLAGVFVIFGLAGLALTPVAPTLLAVGAAVTLFGIGILAAGAGVLAFSAGLTALAVAVTASGGALVSFVKSVLSLIPIAFKAVGDGIIAFAGVIANGGPALVGAMTTLLTSLATAITNSAPAITTAFIAIITSLLTAITTLSPRIVSTLVALITALLNGIVAMYPRFVTAGLQLITSILNGIAQNIPQMATAAGNVVIAFINAIGAQASRIAQAGVAMIINFINAVASQIRTQTPQMNAAGRNLASAIVSGMVSGVTSGVSAVANAVRGLASSALSAAKGALGIHSPSKEFRIIGGFLSEGLAVGVDGSTGVVNTSVENMATSAMNTIKKSLSSLSDVVSENVDVAPRITPVIDLSQAKKGFGDLASMSKSQLISANVSTNKATLISAASTALSQVDLAQAGTSAGWVFNQYNSSPKALSSADIYRQTKNQLSVAKGALPT